MTEDSIAEQVTGIFNELADRSDTYFGVFRIGNQVTQIGKYDDPDCVLELIDEFEDDYIGSLRGSLEESDESIDSEQVQKFFAETISGGEANDKPLADLEFCSTDELYAKIKQLNVDAILLNLIPTSTGESYLFKSWVWVRDQTEHFSILGMLRIGRHLLVEKIDDDADDEAVDHDCDPEGAEYGDTE